MMITAPAGRVRTKGTFFLLGLSGLRPLYSLVLRDSFLFLFLEEAGAGLVSSPLARWGFSPALLTDLFLFLALVRVSSPTLSPPLSLYLSLLLSLSLCQFPKD